MLRFIAVLSALALAAGCAETVAGPVVPGEADSSPNDTIHRGVRDPARVPHARIPERGDVEPGVIGETEETVAPATALRAAVNGQPAR